VKSLIVPPLIVFTTAYSEYAVEGFRVNAVDYRLKPFGMQEFLRAANRLKERLESNAPVVSNPAISSPGASGSVASGSVVSGSSADIQNDILFLKTDYRIVKVKVADIRYIEGMSEYLKVWVEGEPKPIITLLSMKKMEDYLPDCFMRIHRSYIVNLTKVQEVNKNRVIMDADTFLPIGELYKEAFQAYVDSHFLGR
jgi:DNA-binding LytR/AlgR family response regulator